MSQSKHLTLSLLYFGQIRDLLACLFNRLPANIEFRLKQTAVRGILSEILLFTKTLFVE